MKKTIVLISLDLLLFISGFVFYLLNEKKLKESFYKENWGYQHLNIDILHTKYGLTGKKVKVALIDTGFSEKTGAVVFRLDYFTIKTGCSNVLHYHVPQI